MIKFLKRLGGHVGNFVKFQQDGNFTSGVGLATAVLIYGAQLAGIPLPPDTAAAIVLGVMTLVGAGKRPDADKSEDS